MIDRLLLLTGHAPREGILCDGCVGRIARAVMSASGKTAIRVTLVDQPPLIGLIERTVLETGDEIEVETASGDVVRGKVLRA